MAKIKVNFNNKDYQIEESAFASASEKVVTHLTGEMKGTGATVKFGGTAYDVDSTKLNSSAAALAAHLGAIVGSGVKIVIGGVEYGVDSAKVAGAVTEVETTLATLSQTPSSEGLKYTSNGDGTCYVSGIGTCTDTDVVIPSVSPEGDRVVKIGYRAFYNCTSLANVTIPDGVTSISERAFYNCTSLTSITIPNSVTSIGDYAFYRCISLTSITIPNSVTSIGNSAFDSCSSLTSITIPNSVTFIGGGAFDSCTSLTSVTLVNGITSISIGMFEGCTSLTNITIPNSVTSISSYAFEDCASLTSITIPDSVTSIGYYTFQRCTSLTSIIYSGTMAQWETIEKDERWDDGHLIYCTIHCSDGILDNGSKGLRYTLNSDGVSYSISGADSSIEYAPVIIPPTYNDRPVTKISDEAFKYLTFPYVGIPNSVKTIGDSAFNGVGLYDINIPNGVTDIGAGAFYQNGASSIYISESVKHIGESAFGMSISTDSITVAKENTTYRSEGNCLIETSTKTVIQGIRTSIIPEGVQIIGDYAFNYCSDYSFSDIIIPNGVTKIGIAAFGQSSYLESVTIPDTVTSIGERAFEYCYKLANITYNGTIAQWNAISKYTGSSEYYNWDYRTGSDVGGYTVHCTDGDITVPYEG